MAAPIAPFLVSLAFAWTMLAFPSISLAAKSGGGLIVKNDEVHKNLDLALLLHAVWWGGIGTGIRLGIPVAPKGLPGLNDQVKIEFGASFQNWWTDRICHRDPVNHPDCVDSFFRLAFPLLLRWDFFLTKIVTVYGTIGVEVGAVLDRQFRDAYHEYYYGWVLFAGSAGIIVSFHERVALRAEFAHSGFNLGVEFKL